MKQTKKKMNKTESQFFEKTNETDKPLATLAASLVAQRLESLPLMQETWVRSLGQEDPLKKEMATHFNILSWKIPWTKETGWLQSVESQKARHNLVTKQQVIVDGLRCMNR